MELVGLQAISVVHDGSNVFITTVQNKQPKIFILNFDLDNNYVSQRLAETIMQSLDGVECDYNIDWLNGNVMIPIKELNDQTRTGEAINIVENWPLTSRCNAEASRKLDLISNSQLKGMQEHFKG